MTLRTLNYGNYGIFLIMGNAGFCPSTVGPKLADFRVWSFEDLRSTFAGLRLLGRGLKLWGLGFGVRV